MSLFLLSLVVVAVVFSLGALIVRAIATIPLDVLARAEEGGRYVGLGSEDGPSPAAPAAGQRVAPLLAANGHGY
jgi:hypothetical protein